jgi:hypothetical protein
MQAMPLAKIGPHFLNNPPLDEVRVLLARWQPTVLKSLGDFSYLRNIADVVPNTKLVQRFYWSHPYAGSTDQFALWHDNFGAKDAVEWLNYFSRDLAGQAGSAQMYVETFNEVGTDYNYLRFEAERTRRLFNEYGLKSAVINAAVGTTDAAVWSRAQEVGLLDAVRDTGSYIGLHCYAGMFITLWHGVQNLGEPQNDYMLSVDPKAHVYRPIITYDNPDGLQSWLAFRTRQDHEHLKALGYGDIKFILTEFGIDNAGVQTYRNYTNGESRGGWKTWIDVWSRYDFLEGNPPESFYADQLLWANYQLLEYPFIEGATVFCYGSDPNTLWRNFDIRPKVAEIFLQRFLANEPVPKFRGRIPDSLPPPVVVEVAPPPGPGPIHGMADWHFLMFASNLESEWFLNSPAAQRYQQDFQPTLMTDVGYIDLMPYTTSLAVTVVSAPQVARPTLERITGRWTNVALDVVTVESESALTEIFASRVAAGKRFG